MKKINIKSITKADKTSHLTRQRTHCISLGNGSINYFSNITKAKEFLAKTNRFLNERLFDLNELYIDVHTHFQRNWFYFNNDSQNIRGLEHSCYKNFELIQDCMNLVCTHSHYTNGNHFTFKHLNEIQDCLINTVVIIKKIHVLRDNYAESRCMDVLIRRIKYIKTLINNYPKDVFCNQNSKASDVDHIEYLK